MMQSRLRRFAAARKGLAALEFALLAPMMIFVLFGSVELIDMLSANKRVHNATSSVADVIARDTEVSNAEVAGLWEALDILMYPSTAENMDIRISSVLVVDENTAQIVWSEGRGLSPRTPGSEISLPEQMMTPGSSVIMAESEYPYQTPLGLISPTAMLMKHQAFRRSRLVDPIPRVS